MRTLKPWTLGIAGIVVIVLAALTTYAAIAQAPAKAPVPAERADRADAEVPPMPGDRAAKVRERADAMQRIWRDGALLSGRGATTTSMVVEGEHLYLLYGYYLLQFSVDGLQLEAKVDLRGALGLGDEARERLRETRKTKAAQRELVEPAEEQ